MATSRELYQTLHALAKFEVVGTPAESAKQIRFMGRVRDNRHSRTWQQLFVRQLLIAARGQAWSLDISRQNFIRGPGDDLFWGWRIILQGENVVAYLDGIIDVLRQCAASQTSSGMEVSEMPLVGSPKTRNAPVNGKGATDTRGTA